MKRDISLGSRARRPPKERRWTRGAAGSRRISLATVAALTVVLSAVAGQANAAGQQKSLGTGGRTLFTGTAFGTSLTVGTVIVSAKSALSALPGCGTFNPPASAANTIATVEVGGVFSTGAINTSVDASVDQSGTLRSVATSDANGLNIFDGLISASELKEVSTTTQDQSGFHVSTDGTLLVGLIVAGVSIQNPGVNQKINLPGIGFVIVNEQKLVQTPTSAIFTVNLLHVVVTQPNKFAAVGTEIIVASASSGIMMGLQGTLSGFAYGTYALIQGRPAVILSGQTASVIVPCNGTHGRTVTASVTGVSVDNIFTTGAITSTAVGKIGSRGVSSETTSTLAGVNVAAGLVTVDTIKSDAHASTDGITPTVSDGGSQFVNLSVSGHPEINDNVAPNTSLSIAGLGTLWLRHEYVTKNAIAIIMVELIVDQQNSLGIPIGADIQVGVADAAAY